MLAWWCAIGLQAVGVIDSQTAALIAFLGIGYALGWIHSSWVELAADHREAAAMLSSAVDQMGTVLAEEDLEDDQRELVQQQRAGALELLRLMEREPLHRRLRQRIMRRGSSLV